MTSSLHPPAGAYRPVELTTSSRLVYNLWTDSKYLGRRSARLKASNCTGQHRHWKKHKCIHATNWIRTYDPNVSAAEGRAWFTYNGHCDWVLRQQMAEKHFFHLFNCGKWRHWPNTNNWVDDWLTDQPTKQPTNQLTNYIEESPFEKPILPHLIRKFPACYCERTFVTVLTTATPLINPVLGQTHPIQTITTYFLNKFQYYSPI
jgi:hypothetical protein